MKEARKPSPALATISAASTALLTALLTVAPAAHQYLKQTDTRTGDKAVDSEIINTGTAMYVMVGGKWSNSPVTASQVLEQEEKNRRNAKVTTCRVVRDESFDGVTTTLFSAHTETDFGASDEQLWIAKGNGLPLREIIEMDMGDHGGKSRAEIHVVYSGIQAPALDSRQP
jgi:hypothetical protein